MGHENSFPESELDCMPKVLVMGKCQQGKSQFIKMMSKNNIEINIGNGMLPCTRLTTFYPVELRATGE